MNPNDATDAAGVLDASEANAPAVPVEGGTAALPAARPFAAFTSSLARQGALRSAITAAYRRAEPDCVASVLEAARLPPGQAHAAHALAVSLARGLRERRASAGREGLVQGLIQEFSLSSQEGVALMCLAEALLRIPDAATRDALIRDKIGEGDWRRHLGRSPSLFVNAATWGLVFTGKLVATHDEGGLANALARVVARSGEPLIRKGVDMAMRLMGEQFVTGETIDEALSNARRREAAGFRYSYDMLGEAALTAADAERYLAAYEQAIDAIGRAAAGRGIHDGAGISIKLSALHPRYGRAQRERAMAELYPRLRALAWQARGHDIGLNIDAEEADRLDLSLDLLEALCAEPDLAGWNGVGFVVQAYQKRCPAVIDFLVDLARRSGRRLMVRLVKGAYWDSEIKRAQVDGLEGYPVYTRKVHTDLSYLACARQLLAAPDAVYPQFATHNAHTVAAIFHAAGPERYVPGQYEFQCLHGMGEPLYEQVVAPRSAGGLGRPCRIYAPVGTHETLLAYLVRRLLENGANTSFVNRIADASIAIETLVEDPVTTVTRLAAEEGAPGRPHPGIPLPRDLYGIERPNSAGLDLSNEDRLAALGEALQASARATWRAAPTHGDTDAEAEAGPEPGAGDVHASRAQPVRNPSDRRDIVGTVVESTAEAVAAALAAAESAAPGWASTPAALRAEALERAAEAMEARMPVLLGLVVREAGKTFANAIGEVREAVDFLRYYAAQARRELASGSTRGLGPVVCISPWNFPLSIFTGQVAAALAAGNAVLAKPAEQTPLVAAEAVRLLHAAGVPGGALQLLPGDGEKVGAALVADARVCAVMFTGSTAVARLLQKSLAGRLDDHGRPPVLVAETGGQNAMIVDSSALAEQVVADAIASAFDSAGQRCSALRVLCVQEDAADRVFEMLEGAMRELRVGNPDRLAVDVGPVIDDDARRSIESHVAAMRAKGRRVVRIEADPHEDASAHGTFVQPTLIEIARIGELEREVFGPVLHLLRYRRDGLEALVDEIDATGYGLTLGLHTRIDETIAAVTSRAHAGNQYVNRNMIGAVVGVQPFGGEGLSGTGPKAGGPLYLRRLVRGSSGRASAPASRAAAAGALGSEAPGSVPSSDRTTTNTQTGGSVARLPAVVRPLARAADAGEPSPALTALHSLRAWLAGHGGHDPLVAACDAFAGHSPAGLRIELPGPTGESNAYSLHPRDAVLCVADSAGDRLFLLAAVLAADGRALFLQPEDGDADGMRKWVGGLPGAVRERVAFVAGARKGRFDAALAAGSGDRIRSLALQLAERDGPIVTLQAVPAGERDAEAVSLERLFVERTLSINTAAAGGNASLMTIG